MRALRQNPTRVSVEGMGRRNQNGTYSCTDDNVVEGLTGEFVWSSKKWHLGGMNAVLPHNLGAFIDNWMSTSSGMYMWVTDNVCLASNTSLEKLH
jgi:hypothetical protein